MACCDSTALLSALCHDLLSNIPLDNRKRAFLSTYPGEIGRSLSRKREAFTRIRGQTDPASFLLEWTDQGM
jgi:hypothetical protein